MRDAHPRVRARIVKERVEARGGERLLVVAVKLHQSTYERVGRDGLRRVFVGVVLHQPREEVHGGPQRIVEDRKRGDRDREHVARARAVLEERDRRGVAEALEEFDVLRAPPGEAEDEPARHGVDRGAKEEVQVLHVPDVVRDQGEKFVGLQPLRRMREDDDAALLAPARNDEVGVRPAQGLRHHLDVVHDEAFVAHVGEDHLGGLSVRHRLRAALPEERDGVRELPAPEEVEKEENPADPPPGAAGVLKQDDQKREDGERHEPPGERPADFA